MFTDKEAARMQMAMSMWVPGKNGGLKAKGNLPLQMVMCMWEGSKIPKCVALGYTDMLMVTAMKVRTSNLQPLLIKLQT